MLTEQHQLDMTNNAHMNPHLVEAVPPALTGLTCRHDSPRFVDWTGRKLALEESR
jgi:hypothetical protein